MSAIQPFVSPIKIGMVLDGPFPWHDRVERQATALAQAGYQVHLLCLVTPATRGLDAVYRGIYIHRVNPGDVTARLLGIKHRLPYQGLLKAWRWHQYHIDNIWYDLMGRFVDRLGLDVLHIHQLRLLHTGLAIGDKYGIPVVGDLPDHAPALKALTKGDASASRSRWEHIEKLACWQADRVLVTTPEARDRLIDKGIAGPKITLVPDAPDVDRIAQTPLNAGIQRLYKHTFLLSYLGWVDATAYQGLQTALDAVNLLKWDIPELKLVIAGTGRSTYLANLKKQVTDLEMDRFIDVVDGDDEANNYTYVATSDLGICPLPPNDYTNTLLPAMVPLYHAMGRPVIATDCRPLKRHLEDTSSGLVVANQADALAAGIWQLYQNASLRRQLGDHGRQTVLRDYNWLHQAKALIQVYDDLMQVERVADTDAQQAVFAPNIGHLLHSEIYPS